MLTDRKKIIESLSRVGERLEEFGRTPQTRRLAEKAGRENPWFTEPDILRAVVALRREMLDDGKLRAWLAKYPEKPGCTRSLDVGVVTAGNIPLVGFFDILCVLASGHRCLLKPSSKDRVLTDYITGLLREENREFRISPLGDSVPDALLATGSDNTARHFRYKYKGVPAIIRGTRSSAAVLTGGETEEQLDGLASDIFSYSGLGCRNVSYLLIPEGYDMERLAGALGRWREVCPKYLNNFRQRAALLRMADAEFIEGPFFLLREGPDFPEAVSEIAYTRYSAPEEIAEWLGRNKLTLQCVVSSGRLAGSVPFGQAQSPGLDDYPDGADTMEFLSSL